jgi:hypothetical protein
MCLVRYEVVRPREFAGSLRQVVDEGPELLVAERRRKPRLARTGILHTKPGSERDDKQAATIHSAAVF